ncbi:IQ calmodulin-binding domain-containing protein [Pochonia chlamydosporia 170]|uniref:IQ calmodulin-binding domain-containing protein n=1 Tax=Pochonia chlamydosporia 170 TaxID=1380566 RepID=A0A179FAQ6_METCM|nr:IQ calmodulin-binding domain-containing protein [Pochonia chlamydosporia 170]OAQ62615.2 IQ calmodulin-binding domain-containing protein [Pochonia chlamydosporia 170]
MDHQLSASNTENPGTSDEKIENIEQTRTTIENTEQRVVDIETDSSADGDRQCQASPSSPMASVTRSNRRAEGLHHPHHGHHHHPHPHPHPQQHPHHLTNPLTRTGNPTASLFASSDGVGRGGRQKRTLEPADRDIDALKPKKTRIAVEILARHQPPPVQGVRTATVVQPPPIPRPATAVPVPVPAPPAALAPPAPITNNNTAIHKPVPTTTVAPPSRPTPTSVIAPPVAVPPAVNSGNAVSTPPVPVPAPTPKPRPPLELDQNLTKHQAKVINGIKAELDRLQPQPMSTREQGRKLRSQEATRFKNLLNLETPIVVVDSNPRRVITEASKGALARAQQQQQQHQIRTTEFPVRGYGDSLYTDVFDSQRIDFRFLETQQNNKNLDDPLPDRLFEPSHRRAERLERSIRNTEKGRAQHEKDQIIRLLEGLQGHDWLRVMGVSGVTETKKKSFEPARTYFIKGCQSILEKFRTWNLEEKRRKLEKEKALQAEQEAALAQEEDQQETPLKTEIADSASEDDADESEDGQDQGSSKMDHGADEVIEDVEEVVTSQSDTSDASPAKQLRQEALARSQLAAANARKLKAPPRSTPPKAAEPPKELTSFFSKKYERDSALNRTRRTGRKVLAWGHPIPDMEEVDFVLPQDYRDEELLKSRARKKRRDKRNSRP